ncbi:hypothetical protein B0H34DRAFT_664521, partial [Crassisporium funariophilum]
ELLVAEIPTISNLPDIVHFISNTIKDIVKLEYFKDTTTVMRNTITKFHKSHPAIAELELAHVECGIGRGLMSIGKTRFGTVVMAAWALQENLPAIKKVVERKKFDIGYFCPMARKSVEFKIELSELIKVGTPALKALTCLEANEATVGDVYLFWHAMIWAINDVVDDKDFPGLVREQILGILNSHHNQTFGDGNLSTSADLYLAGAYLSPSTL